MHHSCMYTMTRQCPPPQLKDEVLQAREFWSTHDWTGKDPACKLDDKAVTTFTGKAWKGGECN